MNGYISIKEILDNLLDHPMLQGLSLERAVNYAVHLIRIVGMPGMFEEKTAIIDIKDYRGKLPCDFYDIIQVRTAEGYPHQKMLRNSTDNFHMSENKKPSEPTYKIQGGVIFTSIKDTSIEVAYRSILTDDEGYPLIPDNSSFIKALELYIKKEYFTILFDLGKINGQILQNTQQEYAWAVGQAQSSFTRLSIDQMESLTNTLNTLIQRTNEHSTGFKNNSDKEILKIH